MKTRLARGSAALVLAAGLSFGSVAVAAPGPAPAPSAKPAPGWLRPTPKAAASALATQKGPSPLRIGGMLALVAALGGVAYYAHRRRRPSPAGAPKEQPRVLGSTRIGPKATAVVVEIAGKRILLGVTEHSVNNLAWLDDEQNPAADEEVSSLRAAPAARPSVAPELAGPSGFLKLLRNAVGSSAASKVVASDEVARSTRDEVRLSHREGARRERRAAEQHDDELLEGQVMGLVKRRKETP
jgi:flagellar biogenesis protein FliO